MFLIVSEFHGAKQEEDGGVGRKNGATGTNSTPTSRKPLPWGPSWPLSSPQYSLVVPCIGKCH